jgi:hypothetical protein
VWVRRCLVFVAALVIAGACSSGPGSPSVDLACCSGKSGIDVGVVVNHLRAACPNAAGHVVLRLTLSRFSHAFSCATVRGPLPSIEAALASAVADRNDATRRADREIATQHALGVTLSHHLRLVWALGSLPRSKSTFPCLTADDREVRAAEIRYSLAAGESARHWLKVEAAIIIGQCPNRLDEFLRTITAAGQKAAVDADRAQLEHLNAA